MSYNTKDGGHAFPTIFVDPEIGSGYQGMTLRDWFAGMAMQGMIGHISSAQGWIKLGESSYQAADIMLKAREAKP